MPQRYRGAHSAPRQKIQRGKKHSPWPAVLTVVLVLALLAGAFFLVNWIWMDRQAEKKPAASPDAAVSALSPAGTEKPSPTPTPTPSPTPKPTAPPIFDDGTDGYLSEGLYIWNEKAFELFYGDSDAAKAYAAAISSYREQLEGLEVYNMVVPNHSEFGLPERIREDMGCTSQRENTSDVYDNYTADVKAVDIYEVMNLHNDEYLYFNTDTHWAPLGAYYAYTKFCEVAEVETAELTGFEKTSVEGFTGYLYSVTGESVLAENPDHIDLYEPKFSYTAALSYDGETFEELGSINSPDESMGYSMFVWGDNPCVRIQNEDSHTGRSLVIVKDSYGNAIAPFLSASFDEVYVVDFRSFPGNLPAFCEENGVTDVLFFNNVMSANTYSQIETMNGLFE